LLNRWVDYIDPVSSNLTSSARAISSEVEHYLDTVGVTGSIPVSPIGFLSYLVKAPDS
jgi:hypothetical protein